MFVTQLWAIQSYPVEKEVFGVTLDTSEDVLMSWKNGLIASKQKTNTPMGY